MKLFFKFIIVILIFSFDSKCFAEVRTVANTRIIFMAESYPEAEVQLIQSAAPILSSSGQSVCNSNRAYVYSHRRN